MSITSRSNPIPSFIQTLPTTLVADALPDHRQVAALSGFRDVRRARLFAMFTRYPVILTAWGLILGLPITLCTWQSVHAQGGGVANAIGISVENSANAAAATRGGNAGEQLGSPPGSAAAMSAPGAPSGIPLPGSEMPSGAIYDTTMGSPGAMEGYGAPGQQPNRPAEIGVAGLAFNASGAIAGSLAEFFNQPLGPDAIKFKPTILEQAALALHFGDQRKAIALFYAHLIAERESASEGFEAIRYNAIARRPTWAIRVGVSIYPRVADALIDDPEPIREGDELKLPAGRVAGGVGGAVGGEGMISPVPRGRAARQAAAGMPGSPEMTTEMTAAQDPAMLAAIGMTEGSMDAAAAARVAPPLNPAIAAAELADETLDLHLGMVADLTKAELAQRFSAGRWGSVMPRLATAGAALAEKATQSSLALPTGSTRDVGMWIPGVDFIGTGSADQMIAKCREQEIDVLIHFDVLVKETRAEPQYDARCRLVNCLTGENLSVSKSINKRDVLLAARKSSNAAIVAELMKPVFDALDAKVTALVLPPLQPQHAVSRIDTLLASPQVERVDHLAELAMFHQRGLIDDAQFEQTMFFAAGENGLMLVHATPEEKAELVQGFVNKQLGLE